MSQPSTEELLELALADLERKAVAQDGHRGPALAWNDPTERSRSYLIWDTGARSTRSAIETIRRRLGDKHELWVESVTHRKPPNHWAHCYCGWWPPLDENDQRRHGAESDELVIAHIEERTGKPYERGKGGLVGPPPPINR